MALVPVPSRRSIGSARATISARCDPVSMTGPIVVSPAEFGATSVGVNVGWSPTRVSS